MIGDAIPHPTTYGMNTLKLDWKKEAKKLYDELGVRIYAVQVGERGWGTDIQWNLRIKDTWGPEQVSIIQRCPLFGGLKCTSTIGK